MFLGKWKRGVFAKSKWEISGAMTVREMVLHLPVLAHVLQRIFGFSQSTVDKNIEIFWGVNSIHRREIISSSFSHAQASTRERRGANRLSSRFVFGGLISLF